MKVYELVDQDGCCVLRKRERDDGGAIISHGPAFWASAPPAHDEDHFKARVTDRKVNLGTLIRNGIPPIDYLPESDGMLIRGKRHLIPGPKKSGKSITMLVHWVDMARAGANIVIFDRENGAETYARRLSDIYAARDLSPGERRRVERRLHYYNWPRFALSDSKRIALIARSCNADVVVFDATRMFLTDLGLKENEADHYATFMATLVDPLAEANVATVILDNTGHDNLQRPRATAAKGDLNEILFTFSSDRFDLNREGRAVLKIADSRFGTGGEWEMRIGGGIFSSWSRVGMDDSIPTKFAKAAADALASTGPLSQNALLGAVRERGAGVRDEVGRRWLRTLADDPTNRIRRLGVRKKGMGQTYYLQSDATAS